MAVEMMVVEMSFVGCMVVIVAFCLIPLSAFGGF